MFKNNYGYNIVYINGRGPVFESVLIAEKVLGKPLPKGAHVHHVNEIKDDNRNSNLVICQSNGYHNLIHGRMRSLRATGNVHNRKCKFCKQYDKPENMYYFPRGKSAPYHRECMNAYFRKRNPAGGGGN